MWGDMIYVRWRKGESRRGAVFPSPQPDHFLYDQRCPRCNNFLSVPMLRTPEVQLIAVGPVDLDEAARYAEGRWFNAGAVALHEACATGMSDEDLDLLCSELEVTGQD